MKAKSVVVLHETKGTQPYFNVDVRLETHWVRIRRDGEPTVWVPRERVQSVCAVEDDDEEPF